MTAASSADTPERIPSKVRSFIKKHHTTLGIIIGISGVLATVGTGLYAAKHSTDEISVEEMSVKKMSVTGQSIHTLEKGEQCTVELLDQRFTSLEKGKERFHSSIWLSCDKTVVWLYNNEQDDSYIAKVIPRS